MRTILLAVLGACAWQCLPAQAAADSAHDARIEGVVFFSLPKNRARDVLVLKSVGDSNDPHGIVARPLGKEGLLGSVLWLPAGEYQLVAWNGTQLADYPKLTIEAGRLTDGGTLIEFPVGDRKVVLLPVRPPQTAHDIDAAMAEVGSELTNREPLLWQVTATPKPVDLPPAQTPLNNVIALALATYEAHVNKATPHKRLLEADTVESFYAIAKETVPPLTTVAVTDQDGRELYGADLGQIRVRTASGEWGALDTGTLRPVTIVAADGKRLMAGYDDGAVRASDDQGATWKFLAAPSPGWRIAGLEHVGARWLVTAVNAKSTDPRFAGPVDKIRVFSASEANLQDATLVREFKLEEPAYIVAHTEHAGDKLYINVQPAVWRLDVSTGAWTALPTPGDVAEFHLGQPGVVAAWRAKGIFSKLYVSKDDGGNWTKIDHPSLQISDIRMFDTEHGVAVRLNPGAFMNVQEIYDYDRPHDEWQLTAQAPEGCLRLLIDASRHPRYCVTSGASILGLDAGKWVAEYSTE